ncbi:late embryogenesis abundant protein D-34-like [Oryza brachyantha]|uniref:SMP domain-containing protein n=1 Tax=Oryza brachyantha TaxID=4533 RepID=J3MDU7_ORYBR|nr:late embryogenesis abundant protein D-34-like [Oryza brachyantha]
MAQAQPPRMGDQLHAQSQEQGQTEAIKYGHVFAVTGELADQPIAPRDAAAMRSAEDSVPGVLVQQEIGGGYSAGVAMETAAAYNQAVGAVRPGQASDAATNQGIAVTQTAVPGGRIITEFVAGQVVGQYSVADQPVEQDASKITVGEALEATALAADNRPVDRTDVEAIRAAEMMAQESDVTMPGGLTDQAQAAARANAVAERDDDKITVGELLTDATAKLAGDKVAGMEDAARVAQAEKYNDAAARTRAGGVAAAVATAARLNQADDDDDLE